MEHYCGKIGGSQAKLFNQSNKQPKFLEAPVTLIVIGDRGGFGKDNPVWADLEKMMGKEKTEGYQQFASYLYGSTPERKTKFAESNAGLLAMSIMYAAKYYGVDSHAASGIDFEGIKREFNIEGEKEAVMLICLGYFDQSQTLYPRARRFGYKEIVKEV